MSFIVGLEGKQRLGPESCPNQLVRFDGEDVCLNHGNDRHDCLMEVILGLLFE